MAGLVRDENVFVLLLATRWLSLLPPALALLLHPGVRELPMLLICAMAVGSNLLLSAFHPRLNQYVRRHPPVLMLDLAMALVFIAMTGGAESPYSFYALTPLLAAAYFFHVRGGLMAVTVAIPFYIGAMIVSHVVLHDRLDLVESVARILNAYLITFIFAYLSLLLQRVHETTADLQQIQEELARAQTLAALGKLMGFLSHEIRNPLSTLGGYARQIARKPHDTEAIQRAAQIIIEESKRLEELLTDTLDVSRPARPVMVETDLHRILDKACVLAGLELASPAEIKIEKHYDEQLPLLEANSSSLLRAFLNVLRNAVQMMPAGGTVTISTRCHDNLVEVIIADTGPGIPPEVLPTIFMPFSTHRPLGTGLGLAVTQQVIEEHGGRVEARSDPGHGAAFIFHLPVPCPAA